LALQFTYTNEGTDHNTIDPNHAITDPINKPYSIIDHIAMIEYAATDAPPIIIGPAAPNGTDGPCAIHRAIILVRNIAGNTEANPAIRGIPNPDIITAIPIAVAATKPLEIRTILLTKFSPLGAGLRFQHIIAPRNPTIKNPIIAIW